MLFRAQAKPGESVLIHGASGGVGLAACQIAAAWRMDVVGTASTDEGAKLARSAGARLVLNHRDPQHLENLKVNKIIFNIKKKFFRQVTSRPAFQFFRLNSRLFKNLCELFSCNISSLYLTLPEIFPYSVWFFCWIFTQSCLMHGGLMISLNFLSIFLPQYWSEKIWKIEKQVQSSTNRINDLLHNDQSINQLTKLIFSHWPWDQSINQSTDQIDFQSLALRSINQSIKNK